MCDCILKFFPHFSIYLSITTIGKTRNFEFSIAIVLHNMAAQVTSDLKPESRGCICSFQQEFIHIAEIASPSNVNYATTSLFLIGDIGCPLHKFDINISRFHDGIGCHIHVLNPKILINDGNSYSAHISFVFIVYSENTSRIVEKRQFVVKFHENLTSFGYWSSVLKFSDIKDGDKVFLRTTLHQMQYEIQKGIPSFFEKSIHSDYNDLVEIQCIREDMLPNLTRKISRHLLSASSGYFRTLFTSDFKDKSNKVITLTETVNVINIVLDHIEKPADELTFTADPLLDAIFEAADKYDIPSLQRAVIIRYIRLPKVDVGIFINLLKFSMDCPKNLFWNPLMKFEFRRLVKEIKQHPHAKELFLPQYAERMLELYPDSY